MPKIARKTVQLNATAAIGLSAATEGGRFAWELIAAPDGSEARLLGKTEMRVQFTPDVPGRYLVRLHAETAVGKTHHVIRVCAWEDGSIGLTTLEIKAPPAN
jgi:hypothetical protein